MSLYVRIKTSYGCLHLVVLFLFICLGWQIQVYAEGDTTSSFKRLATPESLQKLKEQLAENSTRTAYVTAISWNYDSVFKVETWGEIELSVIDAKKLHMWLKPISDRQLRNKFQERKENYDLSREYVEQDYQEFNLPSADTITERTQQNTSFPNHHAYVCSMFLLAASPTVEELYESNTLYETEKGFIWELIPKEVESRLGWSFLSRVRFAEKIVILIDKNSFQPVRIKLVRSESESTFYTVKKYELN